MKLVMFSVMPEEFTVFRFVCIVDLNPSSFRALDILFL